MSSASDLLSQINELLKKLADLNSNVEIYRQVRSLKEDLNALEQKYESFQNNIKTSTCNAQCKNLETIESNNLEDLLVQLLLSKSKHDFNPPQDVGGFDKPFLVNAPQASAPPASELPASELPASKLP